MTLLQNQFRERLDNLLRATNFGLYFNRLLPKCNDRNKNQNDLFHSENGQLQPKTDQFRHFFGVKNVVNFSNSSRQYSVNGKAKASPLLYHC